jgi:hypothetical protein
MRTDYRYLDTLTLEDENKDVKRGEAVVVLEGSRGGRWRDNHTHGLTVCADPTPNGWKCLGVASTHCNYDRNLNADRGFVCQIGGVCTVVNESGSAINAGDLVEVAVPRPQEKGQGERGIPHDKPRFVFKKFGGVERKHLIGTAMSSAQNGFKFDLKLHRVY